MKIKKVIYLGKIVDFIVEDTTIHINRYHDNVFFTMTVPFNPKGVVIIKPELYLSSSYTDTSSFYVYCGYFYSLNGDELEYVWERYKSIVLDKILDLKDNID